MFHIVATNAFFGAIVFLFFFSFIVAELTGTTFNLISPITLGISGSLIAVVIGASNTPIVKGLAMLALFIDLGIHFIFSPVNPVVLGLVVVPIILLMGMSMAEIGQG